LGLVLLGVIELWMVIIIILRDFGTTFLRTYYQKKNLLMITSLTAKWKTFLQMIFIAVILVLILLRDSDWIKIIYNIPDKNILNEMIFSSFTYYIMLAITFLSIWTLVEYLLVLRKHAINKS
jgi:CDP-diacylglycerol--glycerol-3-phosphate 3-phosphatidyltransferase